MTNKRFLFRPVCKNKKNIIRTRTKPKFKNCISTFFYEDNIIINLFEKKNYVIFAVNLKIVKLSDIVINPYNITEILNDKIHN